MNYFNKTGKSLRRMTVLSFCLVLVLGGILPVYGANTRALTRAKLEVRVWRLIYNSSSHPGIDWTALEETSQPIQAVHFDEQPAPSAAELARQTHNRTSDGLLRHTFAMRRPGEDLIPQSQIKKRIDLFSGVLTDGLSVPLGSAAPGGRSLIIKEEQETIQLTDTDMNVFKAQLIYDSLFPAPVVTRPAAPMPSRQDLSVVIDALKTKHRSTAELEHLLNRVSGRVRDNENGTVDDDRSDRLKTRFTGNDTSGHLIVTDPASRQSTSGAASGQPGTGRVVDRYMDAKVDIGKTSIPRSKRFRRFGPVDFVQLQSQLGQIGRLKVLTDRSFNLISGRPISLAAGPTIPFIRYRPPMNRDDVKPVSTKIGATLNIVPSKMGEDAWQLAVITELVDFIDYPTITKTYLEFSSAMKPGDTLVFKKLVPSEISDDTMIHAEVASAAETLVFLTLK